MKSNWIVVLGLVLVWGCSDTKDAPIETREVDGYGFVDGDGTPTTHYSGQIMRQILLEDLKAFTAELDTQIQAGSDAPSDGDIVAELDFYYRFDSDLSGHETFTFSPGATLEQTSYNDIASGKDLASKVAAGDGASDFKDWRTEFRGWSDTTIAARGGSVDSPSGLVLAFFETIEANTIDRAKGEQPSGPHGSKLPLYVTVDGYDLQQLTQKFLLGAINFNQAADHYLDDDVEGSGLLSDHTELAHGRNDTALEHAWDEGFGYFGASRRYDTFTLEELAEAGGRGEWSDGCWDANNDGVIDVASETNLGASVNAGQRDFDAVEPTDFSGEAFRGFVEGRQFISSLSANPNQDQLQQIKAYRDQALNAWEAAYAATCVHHINGVVKDMDAIGTDDYDFVQHAKGWSELKGLALTFQFNPRSVLNDDDFATLHNLIGDQPMHGGEASEDQVLQRESLLEARALLGRTYGFSDANLGAW